MATWNLDFTDANITDNTRIDSNLIDKIYFKKNVSFIGQIFSYDVNTQSLTQISSLDTGGAGVVSPPIYFKDDLYCATPDGIYIYTGVGTTWNLVESLPGDSYNIDLARSTNHLICILKEINDLDPLEVRYSVDGATWSSGSVDTSPLRPSGSYNGFSFTTYNHTNPLNGVYLLDTDVLGASGPPFRIRLMKWDEGSTTLTTEFWSTSDNSNDDWIVSEFTFPDILYWGDAGIGQGYETVLSGNFVAPSNPDVEPSKTINFTTLSFGYSIPATNLLLHQLPGADQWDSGEVVAASANINRITNVIKMEDDTVYLVGWKSPGGTTFVYSRDTVIPDGPPPGDTGKRLWVYKGNGIDWSSRGLKVA